MGNHRTTSVHLTADGKSISAFFQFLQAGVMIRTCVGCSIDSFLCEELGLSLEYIENRIQTIFLNGKPVDDIHSAILKNESVLALSAAMPGLVGATMRRGGVCAPFRSQITHHEDTSSVSHDEGFVTLKLFNLLTKELGPSVLDRGVCIKKKDLEDFLRNQPDEFWLGCETAKVNGQPVDLAALRKMDWSDKSDLILLSIKGNQQ